MHGGSYETCKTQITYVLRNVHTYQILFIDSISSRNLFQKDSEVAHQIYKLRKYRVQSLFLSE